MTERRWHRAAFLVLLISGSAEGIVFDENDRVRIRPSPNSPYAPIGLVHGSRGYATGVLIDNCHVLTVQHVLTSGLPAVGKPISFKAGITTPHPRSSGGVVVAAGGYERHQRYSPGMDVERYAAARASDWIVARLDKCIGRQLGYVRLRSSSSVPLPLKSAGFPDTRAGRQILSLDPYCLIRGGTSRVLLNDCAALPGNSGSPIFREMKESGRTVLEVYAMQSAAYNSGSTTYPFALSYANVATPVSQILPHLPNALAPRGQPQRTLGAQ